MTPRLCGAEYLRDYKILVTFEDGKTGVIDLEHEPRGGAFEPMRDIDLFRRFRFDPELDTIVWPTGADLAPEYLYENAVVGELQPVGESAVEQPFFPVSKVRVRASDTGHVFRRHWAVVSDDRREIFSIVAEDYRLVSNLRAYEARPTGVRARLRQGRPGGDSGSSTSPCRPRGHGRTWT